MCHTCQASNCDAPRHAIGQKNPRSARWVGLDTSRLFIVVAVHCSLQLIHFSTRLIIFRMFRKLFLKTIFLSQLLTEVPCKFLEYVVLWCTSLSIRCSEGSMRLQNVDSRQKV